MSGYGCGEAQAGGWRARVEVRSLNHRFLDVAVRAPRFCLALDERVREMVGRSLERGRVEVYLNAEPTGDLPRRVRVDRGLARAYGQALEELSLLLGDSRPRVELSWLAQLPGVLEPVEAEVDAEAVWEAVRPALEQALATVEDMRAAEGERLGRDLAGRISTLRALVARVRERAPQLEEEYRARLLKRLGELVSALEPGRLVAEAALHAEKVSIHEELVRLEAHLEEMGRLLGAGGAVGRRLDFLLQEAFREANTMAAKAQDATVSALVVEIKAELEKMREQGQNVV